MGVYYKVVCDELKETISPGRINDLGVKAHAIAYPTHPFGPLVVFTLLTRWTARTCRIISDEQHEDIYYGDEYKDITEKMIGEYNKEYDKHEPLKFTKPGGPNG
jgi:hypothetical protein